MDGNNVDYWHDVLIDDVTDIIMKLLAGDAEERCGGIMLAATCRRERRRYYDLGYRWPWLNARLSAARRGYFVVYHTVLRGRVTWPYPPDDCEIPEATAYREATLAALIKTPNPELIAFENLLFPVTYGSVHAAFQTWMADAQWPVLHYILCHSDFHYDVSRRVALSTTCRARIGEMVRYYIQERGKRYDMEHAADLAVRLGTKADVTLVLGAWGHRLSPVQIESLLHKAMVSGNGAVLHLLIERHCEAGRFRGTIEEVYETMRQRVSFKAFITPSRARLFAELDFHLVHAVNGTFTQYGQCHDVMVHYADTLAVHDPKGRDMPVPDAFYRLYDMWRPQIGFLLPWPPNTHRKSSLGAFCDFYLSYRVPFPIPHTYADPLAKPLLALVNQ